MNAEANGSNWISVSAATTTTPDLRVVGVNFALCRIDDSLSANVVGHTAAGECAAAPGSQSRENVM